MTTIAIEQETMNYWNLLQGASNHVKLALISLLRSSLVSKEVDVKVEEDAAVKIRPEDLEITPFAASIGQSLNPLPADFDYDKEKSDYLITRNKKDFIASAITVLEPQEFIDFLLKQD